MFGGGGKNMRETQMYIKKHYKNRKITLSRGGVVSQPGGSLPPMEGVQISLHACMVLP